MRPMTTDEWSEWQEHMNTLGDRADEIEQAYWDKVERDILAREEK